MDSVPLASFPGRQEKKRLNFLRIRDDSIFSIIAFDRIMGSGLSTSSRNFNKKHGFVHLRLESEILRFHWATIVKG
jgi:hypothetical protein